MVPTMGNGRPCKELSDGQGQSVTYRNASVRFHQQQSSSLLKNALCFKCQGLCIEPKILKCGCTLCLECCTARMGLGKTTSSGEKSLPCPNPKHSNSETGEGQLIPNNDKEMMLFQTVRCDLSENLTERCSFEDKMVRFPDHIIEDCLYYRSPCPNVTRGCEETPMKKMLPEHLSVCGWSDVTCPHCIKNFTRNALEKHETECDHRPVKCGLCHKEQIKLFEFKEHKTSFCPERDVSCIRGCNKLYKASEETEHNLNCEKRIEKCNFCPETVVWAEHELHHHTLCPNFEVSCLVFGCSARLPRHQLKSHQKDDCIGRMLPCGKCNREFRQDELEEHGTRCEMVVSSCPNGCGEEFIRCQLTDHTKTCPLLRCPGCHKPFPALESLQKHILPPYPGTDMSRCTLFRKALTGVIQPYCESERKMWNVSSPKSYVRTSFETCKLPLFEFGSCPEIEVSMHSSISPSNFPQITSGYIDNDGGYVTFHAESTKSNLQKDVWQFFLDLKYLHMVHSGSEKYYEMGFAHNCGLSTGWDEGTLPDDQPCPSGMIHLPPIQNQNCVPQMKKFHPITCILNSNVVDFPSVFLLHSKYSFDFLEKIRSGTASVFDAERDNHKMKSVLFMKLMKPANFSAAFPDTNPDNELRFTVKVPNARAHASSSPENDHQKEHRNNYRSDSDRRDSSHRLSTKRNRIFHEDNNGAKRTRTHADSVPVVDLDAIRGAIISNY